MTLPSSGIITAAMINAELYRSPTAPLNLNDPVVRRLAGLTASNSAISFADFYGKTNEVVATLSDSNSIVLKSYFNSSDWINPNINKRVLIPAGVHIGATNLTYAIAPTDSASGQAGSWKGLLTLENRGTISGMGGQPNSGQGGSCIWMNFPGADGQKMSILNYGTWRAGGGAGGVGGQGGPGYYYSPYTYSEGPFYSREWTGYRRDTFTGQTWVWWNGTYLGATFGNFSSGGWEYYLGAHQETWGSRPQYAGYSISRAQTRYNTVYTSGGAGGTAGRGQGFDGVSTVGSSGSLGGTNAGTGGTGGTGGPYGSVGGTGGTGGTGNNGNGASGAAGGQAGYYIINNVHANITNNGTILGRLG